MKEGSVFRYLPRIVFSLCSNIVTCSSRSDKICLSLFSISSSSAPVCLFLIEYQSKNAMATIAPGIRAKKTFVNARSSVEEIAIIKKVVPAKMCLRLSVQILKYFVIAENTMPAFVITILNFRAVEGRLKRVTQHAELHTLNYQ